MKFIVSKGDLLSNLQLLNKVVPSRATLPALENFLFELKEGLLKIRASDLETTLISDIPLELIEGEGKVGIEAKRLLDILKEFPEQPLTFNIDDETREVTILTESGKYQLPGYDAEEFPQPADVDESAYNFTVKAEVFNKGINKTYFAIADDELRPQLNGIYIQLKNDSLTFASTDAHKLVRFKRFDYSFEEERAFILPRKPADLLKVITAKTEENFEVTFNDKNAVFRTLNFTLIARLVEGQFPDYEAIIPTDNHKSVTIDREAFLSTIKRVSIFANESTKLVKFRFDNNNVEISAQDIDFSISAFEKMDCVYEGEPIDIGFKSVFIMDSLANLDSEQVTMTMKSPDTAVLLYPAVTEEIEDELVLVMPLMID